MHVGEPIERLANNFDADLRHPLLATGIGLCEIGFRFEESNVTFKRKFKLLPDWMKDGFNDLNLKEILLGGPEHDDF